MSWDGSAVHVEYGAAFHDFEMDGRGLALMPTGFAGPKVFSVVEPAQGRAFWFPPRGYGALWESTTRAEPAAATASHHLTTLRDAGLVSGSRVGRRLEYLRTGLSEQLGAGAS